MGIKFGEIDASQILENEFRIKTLEKLVDWLINKAGIIKQPTQDDIEQMKKEAVEELRKKYPKSGISLK